MESNDNKQFVKKMKSILKSKGYEIKTSHIYEVLAQMEGFQSWHEASVKKADLTNVMKKYKNNFQNQNTEDSNLLNQLATDLIDLAGNQLNFKLNDPSLFDWNHSIFGESGSGKTTLVNKLITIEILRNKNPLIYVLDRADSNEFSKVIKLFNGEQINVSKSLPRINIFELDVNNSFPNKDKSQEIAKLIIKKNPDIKYNLAEVEIYIKEYYTKLNLNYWFWLSNEYKERLFNETFPVPYDKEYENILKLLPGNCEPSDKKMELIIDILEVMVSNNQLNDFSTYYKEIMRNLVKNTYQKTKNRFPLLSDFYLNSKEISLEGGVSSKLLMKLTHWLKDGSYPMFDQESNLDFSKDLINFDLKGLEGTPSLSTIYTLLISDRIHEKMMNTKDRFKLIVYSGFPEAFKSDSIRKQFISNLKSYRKYEVSSITTTSHPSNYSFYNAKDGDEILSNMNTFIFGKMFSDKINKLKELRDLKLSTARKISFSGKDIDQIIEVGYHLKDDKLYSTFFVHRTNNGYTIKNELSKLENFLFTNNFENKAIIDYYMNVNKKFSKFEDLLIFLSNDKHFGDQDLINFLISLGYTNKAKSISTK